MKVHSLKFYCPNCGFENQHSLYGSILDLEQLFRKTPIDRVCDGCNKELTYNIDVVVSNVSFGDVRVYSSDRDI